MSSAYRTPGRDIDETEIRRTEIQEAAATKRKLIEERAATRRVRIKETGIVPYVVIGAIVGAAVLVAGVVTEHYLDARAPKAPPVCTEWAEVISHADSARECKGGRVFVAPPVGGQYMVKCICGAAPGPEADGGPS